MDGVIADFGRAIEEHPLLETAPYSNEPDLIPGIFKDLPTVEGAIESLQRLVSISLFDVYILTTAPWNNPDSWSHKRLWVEKNLGNMFTKKVIISHHKNLLKGDFLIDDRTANGAGDFEGVHIHFGWDYINNQWNRFPNWKSVMSYFYELRLCEFYSVNELRMLYNRINDKILNKEFQVDVVKAKVNEKISFKEFIISASVQDGLKWVQNQSELKK